MKRLAREMRDLPKVGLTLELSGAIFVRHDKDRLDKVRVMLVGKPPGLVWVSSESLSEWCGGGYWWCLGEQADI